MAKAYAYYQIEEDGQEEGTLCFICATRRAASIPIGYDPYQIRISLQTDDYELHKCESCGMYINDRIEI